VRWNDEGTPCPVRDFDEETGRPIGPRCGLPRVADLGGSVERYASGPQGGWACAAGHQGWIWPTAVLTSAAEGETPMSETKPTEPSKPRASRKGTPNPRWIKTVQSELKGGSAADLELGRLTLLVGPNGSGKSTVTQSIELVVDKRVSDIAGKDRATDADLASLIPPTKHMASVQLTRDDGATAITVLQRGREATVETFRDQPGDVLPLRGLMTEINGGPDRARRYFFQAVTRGITPDDVLKLIPGVMHERFLSVCSREAMIKNPTEAILSAREAANRNKLDAKHDADGAEKVLATTGAGFGAMPTEAEIAEARAAYDQAIAARQSLQVWQVERQRWETAQRQRSQLEAELNQHAQHAAQLGAWLAALTPLNGPNPERLAAVALLINRSREVNAAACGLCAQAIAAGVPEEFRNEHIADHWHNRAVNIENVLAQQHITQAAEAQQRLRAQTAQVMRDYEATNAHVQRISAQLAMVPAVGPEPTAPEAVPSDEAIRALHERLLKLTAATGQWDALQRAREQAAVRRVDQDAWERLVDKIDETIANLLDRQIEDFTKRVTSFLPSGDVFGLRLRDGKRDVCQFGLVRDGQLHTALSGVEWARVTAALAAAIVSASADPEALRVIIPEDRSWDPATLRAVMRALEDAPCQVILCSAVPPSGKVSKKWKILKFGEVEALKAEEPDEAPTAEPALTAEPLPPEPPADAPLQLVQLPVPDLHIAVGPEVIAEIAGPDADIQAGGPAMTDTEAALVLAGAGYMEAVEQPTPTLHYDVVRAWLDSKYPAVRFYTDGLTSAIFDKLSARGQALHGLDWFEVEALVQQVLIARSVAAPATIDPSLPLL
jgi:energy-coupling factor transporter ATP-binding protein EcfA2